MVQIVFRADDDSPACSSSSFQGNFGGKSAGKCCLESKKTLFPSFSTFLASAKYTLDEKLCKQQNIFKTFILGCELASNTYLIKTLQQVLCWIVNNI